MMDKDQLENLAAQWEAIPSMCSDFDLFEETIAAEKQLKESGAVPKYGKLLFNLPMPNGDKILAGTWLKLLRYDEGAVVFDNCGDEGRVVLDFLALHHPPAGTVIYGTAEKII
ncbi:MAG TPA: hypothetical protein V6C57_28020 [Coleofasciculaceae cyanobacterium]